MRNIPAYAGKARLAKSREWAARKHPRIRGESTDPFLPKRPIQETSPHTRGKLFFSTLGVDLFRNIPAYAGKANRMWSRQGRFEKHPRIRGESVSQNLLLSTGMETSPHTRGKLIVALLLSVFGRNIPAYAGKASSALCQRFRLKKHPRIRGESSENP